MPNIKVSDLPVAASLDGTEKMHVVQNGASKQTTVGEAAGFQRDLGAIAVVDGSTAQSIPNGATPTKLTHFAAAGGMDSHADGMVPDAANSRIVAARAGHYAILFQLSITCGTNNVTWEVYAFVNGVRIGESGVITKLATGSDVQTLSGVAIADMQPGQALDLRAYHNYGAPVNLTVIHASLVGQLMHA